MSLIIRPKLLIAGILSLFLFSCTAIPHLSLNYRIPNRSDLLKGKRVFLEIKDSRAVKKILGTGAEGKFKNFSDGISFSVARGNEPGFKIGVFEFSEVLKEVFTRRLESFGLEVSSGGKKEDIAIVIDLQDFILDFKNRKWIAKMAYKVELVKDGNVVVSNRISGEAERYKLIGSREADTVFSDLVTDLTNRLDCPGLFQQAGII